MFLDGPPRALLRELPLRQTDRWWPCLSFLERRTLGQATGRNFPRARDRISSSRSSKVLYLAKGSGETQMEICVTPRELFQINETLSAAPIRRRRQTAHLPGLESGSWVQVRAVSRSKRCSARIYRKAFPSSTGLKMVLQQA